MEQNKQEPPGPNPAYKDQSSCIGQLHQMDERLLEGSCTPGALPLTIKQHSTFPPRLTHQSNISHSTCSGDSPSTVDYSRYSNCTFFNQPSNGVLYLSHLSSCQQATHYFTDSTPYKDDYDEEELEMNPFNTSYASLAGVDVPPVNMAASVSNKFHRSTFPQSTIVEWLLNDG